MNTVHQGWTDPGIRRIVILSLITLSALVLSASHAFAHAVTEGDAGYIQEIWGVNIIPFMYLGAKHMVTGYDHILFLLGVVFFLYKMKDEARASPISGLKLRSRSDSWILLVILVFPSSLFWRSLRTTFLSTMAFLSTSAAPSFSTLCELTSRFKSWSETLKTLMTFSLHVRLTAEMQAVVSSCSVKFYYL